MRCCSLSRIVRWCGSRAAGVGSAGGLVCGWWVVAAAALGAVAGPRAMAQTIPPACTTTITGTVYSPNGVDPLPNILVYVPTTALQAFPAGVSSCAVESQLVSGTPLVSTTTAFDGTFSLTVAGTGAGLAGNQTLVIQAGKWRRVFPNIAVTACQTNVAPPLAMPQNQSQGDIPAIAISTGSVDALECVFRKMGISDSEFTNPGGGGRINFFAGSESSGATISAATPSETTLVSNQATLNSYDMAMFACQGTPVNPAAQPVANQQNLVNFANVGGRVFTTHYSYVWLNNSTVFAGTANWIPDESISSSTFAPIDATIDQTYAEGDVLAKWLYKIGATPTLGQLPLYETRKDQTGVNPPTQSWARLNDAAFGNPVMQFTFDTPINAATTPTVTLAFNNNPSNFLPGDSADTITVDVTDKSAAADTTLNLTLTLPDGVTAQSLVGVNGNTGWACSVATLTCNRTAPLAAGASDPVALVVSVASTATAGNAIFSAAIAGGGLSGTNQCGRVLFNEYHVENASDHGRTFPNECDASPMTPQEKFLEFSLYNLSNFVAPVSSDQVLIAGQTTLTWPPPAPVTYGTPLSGTQLDATANVPGTFVYTPAAGTVAAVGTNTLSVVFTPTNPAYPTANASVMLNVLPATTTTTISDVVSPIYYGQIIGDVAKVIVTAPNTGGNINVFIDGQNVCTLPVITGVTETCPATTGVGYNAGTHTIYAAFTGNPDYGPSTSPTYSVVVLPDPTTAGVASSTNPAIEGQAVKLTATIGDQYATAAGMVNFFDGATQIGSGTLNAAGVVAVTTTALTVGTHSITACLVASLNFNASCSAALQQQVTLVPSGPLATVTLLGSSVNPSVVGQSVTFSASVATTGAFVAIPAGTVAFRDGATTIGTATLDSKGNASFSTAALTAGVHTITAAYSGVSVSNAVSAVAFAASTSAALMQQVNAGVLSAGVGFVMTVTPTTLSAGIGVSSAVSVTITDLNGFDQPVQLACAGLPNETTCTFAQSTIGAEGGTTALIVSPQGPRPCGAVAASGGGRSSVPWMMAFVVGAFFVRRRRRLLQGLVLMAALCALPMLSGCGDCADLGTKPGNYSFTITGTAMGGSAAVSHTQTMQMIVHP